MSHEKNYPISGIPIKRLTSRPSARRQAELEQSRSTKNADWGTTSQGNRLSAPAATEQGSYERASSKQNHADCEHDKAGRNPPSHLPRHAQHDHYETHTGNRSETTSRIMKLAMRSTLLDPSLAIRIPAALIRPAPVMAAAVNRLVMRP
jgi:hypothetical protein